VTCRAESAQEIDENSLIYEIGACNRVGEPYMIYSCKVRKKRLAGFDPVASIAFQRVLIDSAFLYVFGQRYSGQRKKITAPPELHYAWLTASGKPASFTSARYGEVPKDSLAGFVAVEAQAGGTSTDSIFTI
jgi:hypothetical protein